MMQIRVATARPLVVAVALVLSACNDGSVEPDTQPVDESVLPFLFGPMPALAGVESGTYACPAGGSTRHDMTLERTTEQDVTTVEYSIRLEHVACAMRIRETTLTMDGVLHIEGRNRMRITETTIVVLEDTSRQTGTLRWRHDGYDRTCDVDMTQALILETGERRLEGQLCGHPISVTIPRFEHRAS